MSTARPDSHNCPYDDAGGPLTSKSEKLLEPSISFNSRKQFKRNMISLLWRCLTTVLSLSLLILGLRIFSQMGELSHVQQRGFNAITILLGAFASLGLGSMLGYLGSMLKWRLLAREKYKMQDVELLLFMPSPRGSAALLFSHFREWRLSLTTFIVMLYLLVNIAGRFSVAIFGLTYNLVNDTVDVYSALTTRWTFSVLVIKNYTDFKKFEYNSISYLDLARGGLDEFTHLPDIKFHMSIPQNLTAETPDTLRVRGSTLESTGGNVTSIYAISDFEGAKVSPTRSGHAVHSSASCTMFRLDGPRYWRDYERDDQISRDWKDETNGETIAEVLRVLDRKNSWPREGAEQVTWAAPLVAESNGSSVTYVIYHETAWECTSRLFETLEGRPHPKPLFDSASLFLLPIVERMEGGGAPELTGHLDNSSSNSWREGASSIVYQSFTDLTNQSSPSIGVQALNFYQNGTGGSATQKMYYNLYIAALVARLPIAAIAYGNKIFPTRTNDPNGDWRKQQVETALEVKWDRVGIAAATIVATQILATTAVLYYCRNVYVREDSYLTTAELLKTVLNEIDDGNAMTAKELGDALDKVLEGPVSYGTIPSSQRGQPRVALGREVDYNFPGFPPFRKQSVFRWWSEWSGHGLEYLVAPDPNIGFGLHERLS